MKELITGSIFFGIALTLVAFQLGLAINKRFRISALNPLLLSIIIVICVISFGKLDLDKYQKGADYISYLMTPATVCLAIPLYEKLNHLKHNWKAIMAGLFSGMLTSGLAILGMSILFKLNHQQYVTLLPKSITTAIGIGVSEELGGIVPVTIAAIILSGIFGNVFGEFIMKKTKITHPIAKGVGYGSASHVMGTSKAMEIGEVEGAISSLSLAVSGVLTVIVASIFANFH